MFALFIVSKDVYRGFLVTFQKYEWCYSAIQYIYVGFKRVLKISTLYIKQPRCLEHRSQVKYLNPDSIFLSLSLNIFAASALFWNGVYN